MMTTVVAVLKETLRLLCRIVSEEQRRQQQIQRHNLNSIKTPPFESCFSSLMLFLSLVTFNCVYPGVLKCI